MERRIFVCLYFYSVLMILLAYVYQLIGWCHYHYAEDTVLYYSYEDVNL